jgi:ubiquinone/menaquinone biosynthesis C-methylase UbiE
MNAKTHDLQTGYDRVAAEYSHRIFNELDHKPFDRQQLNRFAGLVKDKGVVCDLGCGPGQIARYLYDQGVSTVMGVDLSPGMIAEAQRLNPNISFRTGDMLNLPESDNSWAGIAAFYSIIHVPREEATTALQEMHRVLQPGGWLLLTFHIGDFTHHTEEWWGETVSIDFVFFTVAEMEANLKEAHFSIKETITRAPNPDVEADSQRAYIFAQKK